jgi:hypothetical protein
MTAASLRPTGWTLVTARSPEPHACLSLRALRYVAEGHAPMLPPVAGLRVVPVGVAGAAALFDPVGGQTHFAELPPGPRRILVTDPERRFLPAAVEVDIPPRHPLRPTAGPASARTESPRITLRLRPGPGRAVPPEATAVIGTVRDAAGRGVALARLACTTFLDGRQTEVVTWSAADGAFVLLLPDEGGRAPAERRLMLHRPVPTLSQALATDFLAALPAGLDGVPPPAGSFRLAMPRLLDADGTPAGTPPGVVALRPRRSIRWDIVAAD